MIVLKYFFFFNPLKRVILSLLLVSFFILGLVNSPIVHSKIEDSINKLIELGEFKQVNILLKLDSSINDERRIVNSILNSYRNNDPEKVDIFVKSLLKQNRFKYFKSNDLVNLLVSKIIISEIYIYLRLLEILLAEKEGVIEHKYESYSLIHHAAGDINGFLEKTEFEYRFNFSSLKLLRLLKKFNFKLNQVEVNGVTPLMISSFYGDDKAVTFFLENGMDSFARVKKGKWKGLSGLDFAKLSLQRFGTNPEKFKFNQRLFLEKKINSFKKIIEILSKKEEMSL